MNEPERLPGSVTPETDAMHDSLPGAVIWPEFARGLEIRLRDQTANAMNAITESILLRDQLRAARGALEGYKAASITVEGMLDRAADARPEERNIAKLKSSAAYKEGYYDGLLVAHCFQAWGEFPEHPENAPRIAKALGEVGA